MHLFNTPNITRTAFHRRLTSCVGHNPFFNQNGILEPLRYTRDSEVDYDEQKALSCAWIVSWFLLSIESSHQATT